MTVLLVRSHDRELVSAGNRIFEKLRIEEHPFVLFDTQLFVFTTDGYSGSGFDAGVS